MKYKVATYASGVLLIFALGDWPYGYYTFLRISVCLTAAFGALKASSQDSAGWSVLLAGMAILFNPIVPIYLDRSIWIPIDLLSAVLLVTSSYVLEEENAVDDQSGSHWSSAT